MEVPVCIQTSKSLVFVIVLMFVCLLYVPIMGAAPRGTIADLGGGFLTPKMKYKIR